MTKLLKILLWTMVSLVLVIVLASVLIPILVDPNDYKEEIAQQVQAKTGRTLTIEGDIDLSISLPLSVSLELGKIELSNAKGFADKPFARMQGASIFVSIMPLITANRLDVGEIKLAGMELNLIKNKQGVTNWADLSSSPAEQGDSSPASEQTPATKEDTSESSSMPAINVAGLTITDAIINWTDEQANQQVSLSKSNINISELIEDKPFNFKISTHIQVVDLTQGSQPAIMGDFSLETKPTISLSKQLFQLPGTQLALDLKGKMLPGGSNKTTLTGDITFDGNTQKLSIDKMALTSIDLTADIAPDGQNTTTLIGNIQFDGKAQKLDINDMKLTSLDMVINGLFHAEKLNSSPEFSGQVSIDQFSPQKLAASLGSALPKMKEAKALNSADVKMTFKGTKDTVTISSLEANLDDTSLKGTASIKNFKAPYYGFDLTLNQLNLDYYALANQEQAQPAATPASTQSNSKKTTPPKPTSSENAPIFPVEMLRKLNLNGKLAIAQFIAGGAKMKNVVIVLKGKNGLVQLAPLKANLYSGSINLNTDIDVRGKTPKLKIINELTNVQIGDLLQDTTGSQEFTGAANIKANITTLGNDKNRLVKNSNGKVNLLVTNGKIKKLDILNTLRKADALLKGKVAPTSAQEKNTEFTELKGTFNVKNGVVQNNDLTSKSPVMELTGTGYADFPKEYLDYTLSVKLLNSLKIDDDSQGTDYKSKEIPYTIKGKFSDLSEQANISKVLEQEVKKSVEKKLNKKLEEKFGDKFKGLLKF